jgi:hypothetical protein
MLCNAAFEQDREPARQQFGVTACDRHDAALADIESDRGDMGRGAAPIVVRLWRRRIGNRGGEQVGERHDAVGQIFAEAAHIANGKYVGGDVHRAFGLVECADTVAGDDGLGADARQRRRRIGPAVEQGQGGDDHPGAQHRKRRQKMLGHVGQLNTDDRVGRQSHVAQPRGDGADNAIGIGVGEAMRLAAGKARAVERIDQRRRVRPASRVAAENVVERQRGAA